MHRPIPRASSPLTMTAAATSPLKSESLSSDEVPAALRCAYRSKPCTNLRATKVNGDLHKLCDHHRQRANINQQRVHLRRQLEKKHARSAVGGLIAPDSSIAVDDDYSQRKSQCSDLSMQDLVMLELILSYEPSSRVDEPASVETTTDSNNNVDCLSFLEQLQCVM